MPHKILWHYNAKNKITAQTNQWVMRFFSRKNRRIRYRGVKLGVILSVDLPDMPRQLRYAAFQAKKVNSSASIPKDQYQTLVAKFGEAAAYLFYDMNVKTALPPMVVQASAMEKQAAADSSTKSFSMSQSNVDDGIPLSLWLLTRMAKGEIGASASSFYEAMSQFSDSPLRGGRLAILSIGRSITLQTNNDNGMVVDLGPIQVVRK